MKKEKKKTVEREFLAGNFLHAKKTSFLIFIFSFLIGINTINHSFTVDDELYYSGNKIAQKGIGGIKEMFTKGSTSGFKETGKKDLYRPLVMLSFGIEKDLFNNNPHASHFIQIILYSLACLVLYSLLNILFASYHYLIPVFITLLFASHPAHTEVIASIKSRDELLAFLFSMLALRQFVLTSNENKTKIISGLIFLLCALLSKESAVMMVLVIPLTLYFFTSLSPKKIAHCFLFSSGVLVLFLWMRNQAVPFSTIALKPNLIDNSLMAANDTSEMLATAFLMLGFYLKFLFLPYPLSYDYSYNQIPVVGWDNFFVIASFILYLAMFIYAIVKLKRREPIAFGILFFLLTFFISSNLYFKIDATIGIRFLFTPVLGFWIAIVFTAYKLFKINPQSDVALIGNKKGIIVFSLVLFLYSSLTIARNADWKDNFTLFSQDEKVCPNSTRIQSSLAFQLVLKAMKAPSANQRNELLQEAVIHYNRAVEIYPMHPDAYYNLGLAYFNLGEREKAFHSYWKASEVNPVLKQPLKELGGIYYNEHQNDSALYYFKHVLQIDSSDADAKPIVTYLEQNR